MLAACSLLADLTCTAKRDRDEYIESVVVRRNRIILNVIQK